MSPSSDEDDHAATLSSSRKTRRSSDWGSLGTEHRSGDFTSTGKNEPLVDSKSIDNRSNARPRSASAATAVNYKSQWASAIGAQ